jgi:energy-coupling factor transporter transmembrane protein EcfT
MATSLSGSGGGMFVVLIGFLVLLATVIAAAGGSFAFTVFGFALLVFVFFALFMMMGGRGRAGMRW